MELPNSYDSTMDVEGEGFASAFTAARREPASTVLAGKMSFE
jgi:hypothetical protein